MQTRLPIFEHEDFGFDKPNQWKNPFYPQHHFSVPSSVSLFQRTETVETNFTDVFMTRNQFESKFTQKTVKKGFFSKRSREVYFYQKRIEELASVRIEMEKQISWYDLKLDPRIYFIPELSAKYMNPALKQVIEMLGTNYNDPNVRAMYRQIIEYWGPEFIIGARMGGAYRTEISFEKELLKTYTIDMVKTQSSFSFFGFIKSSKYNFKNDTRIDAWFKEHAKTSLIVKGGRFSRVGPRNSISMKNGKDGFEGFAESVRTDPEALQYDIVPLTVIIRDPVKHQLMTRAIQEYRKELEGTTSLNGLTETEKKEQCKSCVCISEKCLPSEWQFVKIEQLVTECQKDIQCYAKILGSKTASCIAKC